MEKSSFFNSINHDRVYDAADFAAYYGDLFTNGIVYDSVDALRVEPDAGFALRVHAGSAWVNGYRYFNTGVTQLAADIPQTGLPRYDRVVVRWDLTQRSMYLAILTGTPSSSPQPPALTRGPMIYELGLADVYVSPSGAGIGAGDITDQRLNASVGGLALSKAYLTDGGAAAETLMALITSIDADLRSGIYSPMPNYAAQESTNRIPVPNGSWTVDRDGFVSVCVYCTLYASDGGKTGAVYIRINGKIVAMDMSTIYSGSTGFNYGPISASGVFPVSRGDIVSVSAPYTAYDAGNNACYFIPRQ